MISAFNVICLMKENGAIPPTVGSLLKVIS